MQAMASKAKPGTKQVTALQSEFRTPNQTNKFTRNN